MRLSVALLSLSAIMLGVAFLAFERWHDAPRATLAAGSELLAFTSERTGNLDIFVMQLDGSNPQRVTTSTQPDYNPVWGCDNNLLFVWDVGPNNGNIYSAQPASGDWPSYELSDPIDITPIIDGPEHDTWPTASCGNDEIVFQRSDGIATNIWAYSESGGERQITFTGNASQPMLTPDGTSIVYIQDGAVWVMSKDGSSPVQWSEPEGNLTDSAPFAREGSDTVLFSRSSSGTHAQEDVGVFEVNAAGEERPALLGDRWQIGFPALSPDGDELFVQGNQVANPLAFDLYKGPFSSKDQTDPNDMVQLTDVQGFDIEAALTKFGGASEPTNTPTHTPTPTVTPGGPTPTPTPEEVLLEIFIKKVDADTELPLQGWVFEFHREYGCNDPQSIALPPTGSTGLTGLDVAENRAISIKERLQPGWEAETPICLNIDTSDVQERTTFTFRNRRVACPPPGSSVAGQDQCPVVSPTPTRTPAPNQGDGDCSHDGRVDSRDALLLLQYTAGLIPHPGPCADTNRNNRVDVIDVSLILQFVADLIDHLPFP